MKDPIETKKDKSIGKVERFSRKVYLESVIRHDYAAGFGDRVTFLSSFIRNVVICAQIFVNSYVCNNYESGDLKAICQQNFWYSICQLIMDTKVTNKTFLSNSIALAFDEFKQKYPSIVYNTELGAAIKGYSNPLTATCVTVATTYVLNVTNTV
ncbi:hypothetical protein MFLAVUS_008971 [Mucor flavus]|uniref:Uncharacterized protein n=1 Tax=Mucor flavus TaxID=439312 RepID=A0ABP9Z8R3_9FUNG